MTLATQLCLPLCLTLTPTEGVDICHAHVHATTLAEAVDLISGYAATSKQPAYVVTTNAQHVVLLAENKHFREIYAHADLVVPDGFSLLLASRLVGKGLKERVAGVDLMKQLCARAANTGLRVFLLGGKPGSAKLTARHLKAQYPTLNVAGIACPPRGFETDPAQLAAIDDRIRAAKPDILFVGLGAPKQENWIYERGLKLGVPVSMGVGGSFELLGGVTPRAPQWMQRAGLEWLFRFAVEPRRLWKRYLIGNLQFSYMVLRQCVQPNAYATSQWAPVSE
jgi:N-acetylglucosaminyldiphosphoundecaprenol N-acetyl-beta-D-mannosaminyltransferase